MNHFQSWLLNSAEKQCGTENERKERKKKMIKSWSCPCGAAWIRSGTTWPNPCGQWTRIWQIMLFWLQCREQVDPRLAPQLDYFRKVALAAGRRRICTELWSKVPFVGRRPLINRENPISWSLFGEYKAGVRKCPTWLGQPVQRQCQLAAQALLHSALSNLLQREAPKQVRWRRRQHARVSTDIN